MFRGISDNPNPALKRLTISFLALEGKGLLVPGIRRQRFTRIVKAPKRISSHLELGYLNVHVPIMCKPIYTAAKTVTGIKSWRLLFIFSAGFRLSHETSSQDPQSKNKLPC